MGIFKYFDVIMNVMLIVFAVMFIFAICFMCSSKLRGKVFSKQIKAMKYMVDESKDDLENITSTVGDISVKARKNIVTKNEEDLKNISSKTANIHADAIETTVRAIKKGLTQDVMYCKHCGQKIASDSIYCKNCGKKQ